MLKDSLLLILPIFLTVFSIPSQAHPEHSDFDHNLSACKARLEFINRFIPDQLNSLDIEKLESLPFQPNLFQAISNPPSLIQDVNLQSKISAQQQSQENLRKSAKLRKPIDPSRPPPKKWTSRPHRRRQKKSSSAGNTNSKQTEHIRKLKTKAKEKLATQGSTVNVPSAFQSAHNKIRKPSRPQTARRKKSKR